MFKLQRLRHCTSTRLFERHTDRRVRERVCVCVCVVRMYRHRATGHASLSTATTAWDSANLTMLNGVGDGSRRASLRVTRTSILFWPTRVRCTVLPSPESARSPRRRGSVLGWLRRSRRWSCDRSEGAEDGAVLVIRKLACLRLVPAGHHLDEALIVEQLLLPSGREERA